MWWEDAPQDNGVEGGNSPVGRHCGVGIHSGVVCPTCRASYEVCANFKSVLHCGTGPDRSSETDIREVVNAPQGALRCGTGPGGAGEMENAPQDDNSVMTKVKMVDSGRVVCLESEKFKRVGSWKGGR